MSFFGVALPLRLLDDLPGLAPAGDLLSFCGAKKKVGKEKGPSLFGQSALKRALRQTGGQIYQPPRFIAATEALRPNQAPLFLLTFFLARQKKSESPAGARPGKSMGKKSA